MTGTSSAHGLTRSAFAGQTAELRPTLRRRFPVCAPGLTSGSRHARRTLARPRSAAVADVPDSFQLGILRSSSNLPAHVCHPITMRSLVALVLLLLFRPAHADDAARGSSRGTPSGDNKTEGLTVRTRSRLLENDGPLLRFDGILPVNAEAAATIDRSAYVLDLG